MYKIGEFSKINRVTVKTLRLYDELGLLKPHHVDSPTGYRFYENNQMPRLHKIIALKQIGFSLEEIGQIIEDESSVAGLQERLQSKLDEVSKTAEALQLKLLQIKHYINALSKESKMEYQILIKQLPAIKIASMRKVIANYDELNTIYPRMGELMAENHDKCAMPAYCFTLYHDGEYKERDIDVEICESVTEVKPDYKGMHYSEVAVVPEAACLYHKGVYKNLGKAYAALMQWTEANSYEICGLVREVGIDGIWNKDNPEEWLTEIQAPIRKK